MKSSVLSEFSVHTMYVAASTGLSGASREHGVKGLINANRSVHVSNSKHYFLCEIYYL